MFARPMDRVPGLGLPVRSWPHAGAGHTSPRSFICRLMKRCRLNCHHHPRPSVENVRPQSLWTAARWVARVGSADSCSGPPRQPASAAARLSVRWACVTNAQLRRGLEGTGEGCHMVFVLPAG